jgi:hypothetical protein
MRWTVHGAHLEKHNADRIWLANLKNHLEDSDVDGTTLKWILNGTECKGVGWIHLARDKDQANTLMNLSFPQNGKLRN